VAFYSGFVPKLGLAEKLKTSFARLAADPTLLPRPARFASEASKAGCFLHLASYFFRLSINFRDVLLRLVSTNSITVA